MVMEVGIGRFRYILRGGVRIFCLLICDKASGLINCVPETIKNCNKKKVPVIVWSDGQSYKLTYSEVHLIYQSNCFII